MKIQIDWDNGLRSGFLQFDAPNVHSAVEIVWNTVQNNMGCKIKITAKATRWIMTGDKETLRKDIIDLFEYEGVSRHTVWNIDGTMAHLADVA